jgi:hypothetical protein
MSKTTKPELLLELLNGDEQITIEDIMTACNCSQQTAANMAYFLVNFRLAYRGDNKTFIAMQHPAEKALALEKTKVERLEAEKAAAAPAIAFATAFKSFMKD